MPGSNGHRSRQMWEARGGVYVYMAEIAHAAVGGRRGHKPKDPHPIWDPKGGRFGAAGGWHAAARCGGYVYYGRMAERKSAPRNNIKKIKY